MIKKHAGLLGAGLLFLAPQCESVQGLDSYFKQDKVLREQSSLEDSKPLTGTYTASKGGQTYEITLNLVRYSATIENHTTYLNLLSNELRSRSELWPGNTYPQVWLIFASQNGSEAPLFDNTFAGVFTGGSLESQGKKADYQCNMDYEIGYYLISRARGYGIATNGLGLLLDRLAREDRYPYVSSFFLKIREGAAETVASGKIAIKNSFTRDSRATIRVTDTSPGHAWVLKAFDYRQRNWTN